MIPLNENNNKGTWTQFEDEQLISAVSKFGAKKWIDISKLVPTRTSKQCRERWHHRLDPIIKHEPFEPWEDTIILEKQKEIGNKWSIISQKLPGRSASSVKNRWYSCLKNQNIKIYSNYLEINHNINEYKKDIDFQIQNNEF